MQKIKEDIDTICTIGSETMHDKNASIAQIPDMMDALNQEYKDLAMYVQTCSVSTDVKVKIVDLFDSYTKVFLTYQKVQSLSDIEAFFDVYKEYEIKLIEVREFIDSYSNFN